jgi:hypothetical protein
VPPFEPLLPVAGEDAFVGAAVAVAAISKPTPTAAAAIESQSLLCML